MPPLDDVMFSDIVVMTLKKRLKLPRSPSHRLGRGRSCYFLGMR
jgi:hypothetical protein